MKKILIVEDSFNGLSAAGLLGTIPIRKLTEADLQGFNGLSAAGLLGTRVVLSYTGKDLARAFA